MQTRKNRLASYITAGLIAGGAATVTTPVVAEPSLGAGVEISNMYLWRGLDLGSSFLLDSDGDMVSTGGVPMIAGSLEVDSGFGLYAGTWAASGDANAGTELDLYIGYATNITDEIAFDGGVVTYTYPSTTRDDPDFVGFGDLSEAYLSLSGYGFGLDYYNNIAGASGYEYFVLSYGAGPFGAALGHHNFDSVAQGGDFGEDMTHLDLSFAFNDNLSFTASTIVDSDIDDNVRSSTLLQAVYSKSFNLY